jgi:hypothetical protein
LIPLILQSSALETTVIYFRAGYTPDDYPTEEEWAARLMLERSRAIKCPDIAYHLAGTKKVQQVLAVPGEVERFLNVPAAEAVRSVFAGLYSLDHLCPDLEKRFEADEKAIFRQAIERPDAFVLKPQREGGGYNIYGEELKHALQSMSSADLSSHILMERIAPPTTRALLVRNGESIETDCVCELGIFSVYLHYPRGRALEIEPAGGDEEEVYACAAAAAAARASSAPATTSSNAEGDSAPHPPPPTTTMDGDIIVNKYGGYLLRVKPITSDEGGVAAGYSVLSSLSPLEDEGVVAVPLTVIDGIADVAAGKLSIRALRLREHRATMTEEQRKAESKKRQMRNDARREARRKQGCEDLALPAPAAPITEHLTVASSPAPPSTQSPLR